jgi:hypothetical protein
MEGGFRQGRHWAEGSEIGLLSQPIGVDDGKDRLDLNPFFAVNKHPRFLVCVARGAGLFWLRLR